MKKMLSFVVSLCFFTAFSQETIGITLNSDDSAVEYLLFNPDKSEKSYLVNNCGYIVNQWEFTERPGLTSYLLENGNLLRAGKDEITIRDWDNNLVWSYDITANGYNQHHDIEPLPNGNILCVVHDNMLTAEAEALGKDPNTLGNNFKMDKIIELQPVGSNSANIVWEWNFRDHLVQDYDVTKPNYGDPDVLYRKLDFNRTDGHETDYTHVNGIDYNEELDQIMLSARHTDELYIIDHSTTTIEATGSTGGNSGYGGDFLWRWGNVQNYGQGSASDQKLRKQHDSKWIDQSQADFHKVSVFNNGGSTGFESAVHIINLTDSMGHYKMANGKFLPSDFEVSWDGNINGGLLYEGKKSGVQILSNGNFLVTQTSVGRVTEIDRNGNEKWSYTNPVILNGQYAQYEIPTDMSTNGIFRGENYKADYPGFDGRDLTPSTIIEDINNLSNSCLLSTEALKLDNTSPFIINTCIANNTILFSKGISGEVKIYDISGRLKLTKNLKNQSEMNIYLPQNLYILKINNVCEKIWIK